MKKVISTLLLVLLFIPFIIKADVTSYDEIDIRITFEEGKKVNEMQYSIYASTNEDEELIDRTSEFTHEAKYFKEVENGEKEEISGDYIFKEDETYSFNLLNVKPINEATLGERILVNNKEQDSEALKFTIENNTLNIEYYPTIEHIEKEEPKQEEPVTDEGSTIANDIIKKDDTCVFGLSLCCNGINGISYCVLGIIGVVLLVLIIMIVNMISDRREDKKYKDF